MTETARIVKLHIAKLDVKGGDVLVVRIPDPVSCEYLEHLSKMFDGYGAKVIFLCGDAKMDFQVIKRDNRFSMRRLIQQVGQLLARVEKLEGKVPDAEDASKNKD